jgi:hypothetical protein
MIKKNNRYWITCDDDTFELLNKNYSNIFLKDPSNNYSLYFLSPFKDVSEEQINNFIKDGRVNGIYEIAEHYFNRKHGSHTLYAKWFIRLFYLLSLEESEVKSLMALYELSK